MIFVSRLCVVSSSEILERRRPLADRRFASARIRSSKSSHAISRVQVTAGRRSLATEIGAVFAPAAWIFGGDGFGSLFSISITVLRVGAPFDR